MAEKKESLVTNTSLISGKSPEIVALPENAEVLPIQATDKTVKGGRYVVNDQLVDCDGKPIKE